MTLRQKQSRFVYMVSLLIQYAYQQGYELTFGDTARMDRKGHRARSFHYKRLAVDFNLFKDGIYQTTTKAHKVLGDYWIGIGGSWGGEFPDPDGNHYSLGEGRSVKKFRIQF